MPAARNHYQILNVAPDAEPVVIEAAYRALMKKYHPDQSAHPAGEGPSASRINQAFATLRDAERRADYDRREWTKSQDIQLAATRPPPTQRVSRVFGWGGWVVAAILGGVLALVAGRANEVAIARADAARASASAEPDLRSQPTLPSEPFIAPVSVAAVPIVPTAIAPPAAVLEAELAEEKLLRAPPPPAPTRKVVKAKPQRRPTASARRPRTAAEKDFLERQGYIY
jgi:hypothetical protein